MSDTIVRQIRTWVPIATGAFFTWLGERWGIWLDGETTAGATAFLTGAVSAVWYTLVTLAARRFPWLEVLLGARKAPEYATAA